MTNDTNKLTAPVVLLRRVAKWADGSGSVVSAYLDLRPAGQKPQERPALVVLRHRLDEVLDGLHEHTPEHEALAADRDRLLTYVADELLPETRAAAIFASHAASELESISLADVATDVTVGPRARL